MKNRSFLERAGFAVNGIREATKEKSFLVQLFAAIFVIAVLFVLGPDPIWWAVLLLTCGSVLSFELLNTALERALDRLHPDQHPEIRAAKDCAAGAVLVMSFVSLLVFAALLFAQL